jgi:hypothetical protein
MASAHPTVDHDEIRRWAEKHGGRPAKVETGGPGGILRFDFGEPEANLKPIEWNEFFRIFDENDLALLIQDENAPSRFNKFVQRPKDLRH